MRSHYYQFIDKFTKSEIENKLFIILAIVGIVFSLFTAVLNIFLELGTVPIVVSFAMAIIASIFLYIALIKNEHLKPAFYVLLILTVIIFPLLWFFNGGSYGPTPYFFVFNTALIAILLNKSKFNFMFAVNFITIVILVYIEFTYPQSVVKHSSESSRIADVGVSLFLICTFTYLLLTRIMREYNTKIEELHEAQEKLREISNTDELSGIYNRRYVMSKLHQDINSCMNNTSVSVIMFDIDNFKSINDKYGHSTGDNVIRHVSKTLKNNIRTTDTIGRIGGEEFLIILKDSSSHAAREKAEHLREVVSELIWCNDALNVTISGGVYSKADTDTIEEMLENVDLCLYQAKTEGRNRIICKAG